MYILQGAKCGTVRFEPFKIGVITKETVSRQSTITDNPVEGGGNINDHVFKSPLTFQLAGTVTDGAAAIATLNQMWTRGDILTYTGRNRISNLVIQNLQSTHDATNRKGFTFTATLKQITLGSSSASGTAEMMSDQDSAAAASSGGASSPPDGEDQGRWPEDHHQRENIQQRLCCLRQFLQQQADGKLWAVQ